jgi:GT2 family glycosyltransferase
MRNLKKIQISHMARISASIVLYNTEKSQIDAVIASCIDSLTEVDLYLVDNSPEKDLCYLMNDNRVKYLKSQANHGFGAGHNLAINEFRLLEKYDYHIVINPDIEFDKKVIRNIQNYMDYNSNIGILMPKIINIDGTLQYARRLLPTPVDIFMKRFFSDSEYTKDYEIRDFEPKTPVEIVGLCGCFMFIRTSSMKEVGLFDEQYFMYFEDFDLSRRIAMKYKTIYFPNSKVIHGSNNEHRRNMKLFFYSVRAALKYFNKWGYFDKYRKKINIKTLQKVKNS